MFGQILGKSSQGFSEILSRRVVAGVTVLAEVVYLEHVLTPEKLEPVVGIEPTTDGLQNRCSTTELHWHFALFTMV